MLNYSLFNTGLFFNWQPMRMRRCVWNQTRPAQRRWIIIPPPPPLPSPLPRNFFKRGVHKRPPETQNVTRRISDQIMKKNMENHGSSLFYSRNTVFSGVHSNVTSARTVVICLKPIRSFFFVKHWAQSSFFSSFFLVILRLRHLELRGRGKTFPVI